MPSTRVTKLSPKWVNYKFYRSIFEIHHFNRQFFVQIFGRFISMDALVLRTGSTGLKASAAYPRGFAQHVVKFHLAFMVPYHIVWSTKI